MPRFFLQWLIPTLHPRKYRRHFSPAFFLFSRRLIIFMRLHYLHFASSAASSSSRCRSRTTSEIIVSFLFLSLMVTAGSNAIKNWVYCDSGITFKYNEDECNYLFGNRCTGIIARMISDSTSNLKTIIFANGWCSLNEGGSSV